MTGLSCKVTTMDDHHPSRWRQHKSPVGDAPVDNNDEVIEIDDGFEQQPAPPTPQEIIQLAQLFALGNVQFSGRAHMDDVDRQWIRWLNIKPDRIGERLVLRVIVITRVPNLFGTAAEARTWPLNQAPSPEDPQYINPAVVDAMDDDQEDDLYTFLTSLRFIMTEMQHKQSVLRVDLGKNDYRTWYSIYFHEGVTEYARAEEAIWVCKEIHNAEGIDLQLFQQLVPGNAIGTVIGGEVDEDRENNPVFNPSTSLRDRLNAWTSGHHKQPYAPAALKMKIVTLNLAKVKATLFVKGNDIAVLTVEVPAETSYTTLAASWVRVWQRDETRSGVKSIYLVNEFTPGRDATRSMSSQAADAIKDAVNTFIGNAGDERVREIHVTFKDTVIAIKISRHGLLVADKMITNLTGERRPEYMQWKQAAVESRNLDVARVRSMGMEPSNYNHWTQWRQTYSTVSAMARSRDGFAITVEGHGHIGIDTEAIMLHVQGKQVMMHISVDPAYGFQQLSWYDKYNIADRVTGSRFEPSDDEYLNDTTVLYIEKHVKEFTEIALETRGSYGVKGAVSATDLIIATEADDPVELVTQLMMAFDWRLPKPPVAAPAASGEAGAFYSTYRRHQR
jgi:hypothetical protein